MVRNHKTAKAAEMYWPHSFISRCVRAQIWVYTQKVLNIIKLNTLSTPYHGWPNHPNLLEKPGCKKQYRNKNIVT
jgi:hypothetical protein